MIIVGIEQMNDRNLNINKEKYTINNIDNRNEEIYPCVTMKNMV